MGCKFTNFLQRALSGLVMALIVMGAIYYSFWSFGLLLLVITLGCVSEFYRMSRNNGVVPQDIAGFAAAAVIFGFGFDYFYNGGTYSFPLLIFLMLLIPTMYVVELFKGGDYPMRNIGTTLLALLYVALPLAMLSGVPLLLGGGVWSPFAMIAYVLVIWSNDTFAYLVGVTCGRHKLYERISPLKSWEGFFGGVFGAVAMSALAAYLLDADTLMWIGIGAITSVMGCLGDLVESMFKRACSVKDSGRMMPGHGGWLDRFDSLIFSAPYVIVFLIIYINS